jgi:hypothetical protein
VAKKLDTLDVQQKKQLHTTTYAAELSKPQVENSSAPKQEQKRKEKREIKLNGMKQIIEGICLSD